METIDFGKDAAAPSGAPEAGGATTRGSQFGGLTLMARFLRAVARVARDVEAEAYRRLRDLERLAAGGEDPRLRPGVPNRVRHAHDGHDSRIH